MKMLALALALLGVSCKTPSGPVSAVRPAGLVQSYHARLERDSLRLDFVLTRPAAELNVTYTLQAYLYLDVEDAGVPYGCGSLDQVLRLVEADAGLFPVRAARYPNCGPEHGGWCEVVSWGRYEAHGRRLTVVAPLAGPAIWSALVQTIEPLGIPASFYAPCAVVESRVAVQP